MTATEEYTDVLTEELTDELVQAAAAIPIEPEPESASVSSESEPVSEPADREESANSIDVDIEDMVWEVEDVPGELPEIVTSESSRNDYYDSNEDYAYGAGAARAINKHIFTWIFSFVCGMYGVDRFVRGQIGLGVLKLMTFGVLGFWYLGDLIAAIIKSYGGAFSDEENLLFDRWGRYLY